jgi:hypothetical protein
MNEQGIIDYLNQYRDDHLIDVADIEVTVTYRLTALTLSPFENECDAFDIDVLTVNGLPAAWLKQEDYNHVKANLMTAVVSLGGGYTFKDNLNVGIHDYAADNDIDNLYDEIYGDDDRISPERYANMIEAAERRIA